MTASERKTFYREHCPDHLAIFQQPYYLDAICGKNWDVCLVVRNDKMVGCLSYYLVEVNGLVIIQQPEYAQFIGLWIDESVNTSIHEEHSIMQELINQLPEFDQFEQQWPSEITNWLPFYWEGFEQTTRYSYIIKDTSDEAKMLSRVNTNVKRKLKKEGSEIIISEELTFDQMWNLIMMTHARKGIKFPYGREIFEVLEKVLAERNDRKLISARDKNGNILAGGYFIWDKSTVYYLAGGIDPNNNHPAAMACVMWQGILLAHNKRKSFDFEGSMDPSVGNFFRSFGAELKPYFRITKVNSRSLQIKQHLKGLKKQLF